MRRRAGRRARAAGAVAVTVALVAVATGGAAGSPALGSARATAALAGATPRAVHLPAGLPHTGRYAFLLELATTPTASVFHARAARGRSAAGAVARAQARRVIVAQNRVIAHLPSGSRVLYRTHTVLAGVAVSSAVGNYPALNRLAGVTAVYPIAPKSYSNAAAVPLQRAPQAWTAYGDLGADSTIAIIDSGVDYTHADFGGPGTVAAYNVAHAAEAKPAEPALFPNAKVVGGYDFAGDSYDSDVADPSYQPDPNPDANPLDCAGHGSHVAGSAAGLGENADGSTYTGAYDASTPFATMRVGPGIAPKAKLYAYRVFGCTGGTQLAGAAIDRATDPNGDGDPSDHVNVINMSLGVDYGSAQDGDSVLSDEAAGLGITVVASAGNAGDRYDVSSSPANAPRVISVAASSDAQQVVDALDVTGPAAIAGRYAAERSLDYDWSTAGDLRGTVVAMTDPANQTGCSEFSAADKASVAGKIVFLEWTDDDLTRACGSAPRAANAFAAGARGYLLADDRETFAGGIGGSADLPGVLVAKSAGDAIRTQLDADATVTIGGTAANQFRQNDTTRNDTVPTFTSRGIGAAGDLKPDVTAVGDTVFSAAVGTGNQGTTKSGTSMASPMVAGTAALLTSMHPSWTAEQVKADIMNTADQDLFRDPGHAGPIYGPNRVGAGRIDVKSALDNSVLAYVADDPGSVSASFGSLAVTSTITRTKQIRIENTGLEAHTYSATYAAVTSIPGAVYSVSPSSVMVDARSSRLITLTLTVDAAKLTKPIDPTVDAQQGGSARDYLAAASGRVLLASAGRPTLRVPVYSAPRPVATMTQPASVTLPAGSVQSGLLSLSGHRVEQGTGSAAITSLGAGFELAAASGLVPSCTASLSNGCVGVSAERSADLKYVGVTSDVTQLHSIGDDPTKDGRLYFAIAAQGPWQSPAGSQEFDVLLDTNRDGRADRLVFNTTIAKADTQTDVMVAETLDLATGDVLDMEGIDGRAGDTDAAVFDSDTIVLPVSISALRLGANPRINYAVESSSLYHSVDAVGLDDSGEPSGLLSVDPLHPGVAVFGSYNAKSSPLLYVDSPGSVLEVRRDRAAYGADHGEGALLVHFHDAAGSKAQRMALKADVTPTMTLAPRQVRKNRRLTATVHLSNAAGVAASGAITLVRRRGAGRFTKVASATVRNGTATLRYSPATTGRLQYQARYAGDTNYLARNSAVTTLTIRK